MKDQNKKIDSLPDSFETEEQAGKFWDTHSLMDYQAYLTPPDDAIKLGQFDADLETGK
ncbi:MAG TPA: hypothetical protein VJT71_14460 [Pyrinomonadaceae bacterium]|nr:hypothetical protein [Pyrinomonadaceae bacterium]